MKNKTALVLLLCLCALVFAGCSTEPKVLYQSESLEVIREHACKGKTVNISYDEMKDIHGADIFGSGQPKRAIDSVLPMLKGEGITIRTGKTVKYNSRTRNGFSIYKYETISEVVNDLPD